jgi:GNAT superfamily N-acetyltransferase
MAEAEGPSRDSLRSARAAEAGVAVVRDGDAEGIARLCAQLGYPTDGAAIRRRLAGLDDGHAVFVARRDDAVEGWLHVALTRALEYEPCAEILGLVVDDGARSRGTGAALVAAAEAWARARGLPEMRVRSRDARTRAHAFYRRQGYEDWKGQLVFRKRLEVERDA